MCSLVAVDRLAADCNVTFTKNYCGRSQICFHLWQSLTCLEPENLPRRLAEHEHREMSVLVWGRTASAWRDRLRVHFATHPVLPWPRQDISSLPMEASSGKLPFPLPFRTRDLSLSSRLFSEWELGRFHSLRKPCSRKANNTSLHHWAST